MSIRRYGNQQKNQMNRSSLVVRIVIGLFVYLSFISCSDELNDCLQERLTELQNSPQGCTGASLIKYRFHGRDLYAFSDGQCISDGGTTIIEENCDPACFIGGIAAFRFCEGEDFLQVAMEVEVIWRAE